MYPFPSQSVYVGVVVSTVVTSLIAPVAVTPVQAQVTDPMIYVDPGTGNDQTGTGNEDRPYQTLTQAIQVAPPNAVIQLAPGTYGEQTGETFPIVVNKPVEIRGSPGNQGANVKIEGGGDFTSPTGAGQTVGIALLANARLTGVSVTNRRDRGHGVWIEGASPIVAKNTFIHSDNTGLSVNGTGSPTIIDNYFYNNVGNGMVIYGQTQPLVKNNTFERTGFGISITEQASPQIIGNQIKENRIGIVIQGSARPILKDNTIERSREDGLVAISNSRPNLGTANRPGGNIFRRNRASAIKNLTKNYVIPAHGNQITGQTEGKIDRSGTVTAQTPLTPLNSNSPSGSGDNGSIQEQIWKVPNPAQPSPQNSANESPSPNSKPLTLPPPNVPSSQSQRANRNLPPKNSGRRTLEDLLVLEPNVSPSNPPSQRNLNALPVPNGNISSGNRPGASPEERAKAVGGQYRVIVELNSASDKSQVKAIVPDAFTSRYQGRRVMQVGIFRSQANAQEIRQRLQKKGLQVRVIRL